MATGVVFPGTRLKTHMPFCDGKDLLFCAAGELRTSELPCGGSIWSTIRAKPWLQERFAHLPKVSRVSYRIWKLHHTPWKKHSITQLATGLPENAIECSPAFCRDATGRLLVSFIAGLPARRGIEYSLFQTFGASFDALEPATRAIEHPTTAGFVTDRLLCFAKGGQLVLRNRENSEEEVWQTPFERLSRISFLAADPNVLLLTGSGDEESMRTLLYHVDTQEVQEVEAPAGAYKPSLFGDQMLYVQRLAGIEERQLQRGAFRAVKTSLRLDRQARESAS